MAMGFRRVATSHGVRNNRNPTQAPEAARRVGVDASHDIARGARHSPKGKTNFEVPIISEMCQMSLKVITHILNYINVYYDFL